MPFTGSLEAIYITPTKAAPMQRVDAAHAVAGAGIEGDRYYKAAGTFSKRRPVEPDYQITLIEAEAIEAAAGDYELPLEPAQSRRNLLVRGVPLNHLVGQEFLVGEVRLRGIRLCEPCGHLEKLTFSGIKKALLHRGGLRAEVLRGGELRPGDAITLA